jgi:phosphoribosylamine--glycine ligase
VFHAGTKKDRDRFVSWGGRVLNVIGVGADLDTALKQVYDAIGAISFDGMVYRKDIGYRALKRTAVR